MLHYFCVDCKCSSHRSISFRESMPLPSGSVTHWPIRSRAHWFLLFFLSLFGSRPTVREHLVSCQDRPLSRPLLRTFHIEELHWRTSYSHWRTSLAVSHTSYLLLWHTLPTNSRTNTLTGDTKRNLFLLELVYFCYYNKPSVV